MAAAVAVLVLTAAGCGVVADNTGRTVAPSGQATPAPSGSGATGGGATGTGSAGATASPPTEEPTHGAVADCPTLRCTSVVVTGDMLVHEGLWQQASTDAAETGNGPMDFEPLLDGQRAYLEHSDLAICQMETPVSTENGPFSAYPSFNVPPQILDAAKAVGYDACTTASNHTIDQGTAGLERTLDALDDRGLDHTGSYRSESDAGELLVLETDAADIAVITGTYGLNGIQPEHPWQVDMLDAETMIGKAKEARHQGAEIVLGVMHAGDEYASVPNAQQQEVAHQLADSEEFTMIYGHHTHSVLPIEKYQGTWIAYGLGNGVTELSPWYQVNNEGLLLRAQFSGNDDGEWTVSDLAWAPSLITSNPFRWCSVAKDAPQGVCESESADAASRERTKATVESMGAADDGAHELLITREKD